MRRPRSKLEVSTFPFLAVLLCAMGALLLLLFIMDRRAKIAAQHTVSEAVAQRKQRTAEVDEARKAEWEKARDLLHQSLLDQQNQILAQSKELQQDLDEASKKLAIVQTQHVEQQNKAQGAAVQIALLNASIASQRAGLNDTEKKEIQARTELLEAARELAELERAFQQLRTLRERDKQVYSVVPYHGKRGELRTPIYVECVSAGVLFHPDKKLLERLEFTAESLRREVERRSGPLTVEKSSKEKNRAPIEESTGPYVLFLIRPDGIANYYKAQAALKGYQLDFGYELVDADWVLDFHGAPGAKSTYPGTNAKAGLVRPVETVAVPAFNPGVGVESGGVRITPKGNGGPMTAGTALAPPSMPAPLAGAGPGGIGSGAPSLVSPGGIGAAPPLVIPPRGSGGPDNLPALPPIGNVASSRVDTGIPTRGPAFVPINKVPTPVPIASSGGTPDGGTPGLAPVNLPIPGSNVGGKPGGNPGGISGDPAVEGSGNPRETYAKSAPSFGPEPVKKGPPSPVLSKLLGNRDFVITIDCYSTHVTVLPSGLQYRWSGANDPATDKALTQTVTNLIARRQASVREGEPPYRPVIHFQVAADGLRSYLRAYPLLEPLRLPMTRENVED